MDELCLSQEMLKEMFVAATGGLWNVPAYLEGVSQNGLRTTFGWYLKEKQKGNQPF